MKTSVAFTFVIKEAYLCICCTAAPASSCLRTPLNLKHTALDFGKTCLWQHLVSSHSVIGRSVQSSHWTEWKSWTDELYPSVRTSACSAKGKKTKKYKTYWRLEIWHAVLMIVTIFQRQKRDQINVKHGSSNYTSGEVWSTVITNQTHNIWRTTILFVGWKKRVWPTSVCTSQQNGNKTQPDVVTLVIGIRRLTMNNKPINIVRFRQSEN